MGRSAVQTSMVRVSARSRPPLPFILTSIGLPAFDLVSSRVWWEAATNKRHVLCGVALCPVVGRSRPAVGAGRTVRSGVFHHWIHPLWPQGAVPPGFNPLQRGWVYRPTPEGPRKGECRRGPRHFLELPVSSVFGPATGPTLKTALCHIRTLVGRRLNIGTFFAELLQGKESYVIRGRIRLPATCSGRLNTPFFLDGPFKGL